VTLGATGTSKKDAGSGGCIPGRFHVQGIHVHRAYKVSELLNLRLRQRRECRHIAPAVLDQVGNIFLAGAAELAIIGQCRSTVGPFRIAAMTDGAVLAKLCRHMNGCGTRVLCSGQRRVHCKPEKRPTTRFGVRSMHADTVLDIPSGSLG
jgi:hypothetical protein